MDRRSFLAQTAFCIGGAAAAASIGCRGRQTAQVLTDDKKDMVGSHAAGAETFKPLVQESVARLLGRQHQRIQMVSSHELPAPPKRICFVGVENKSAEEIGDFKEQVFEAIDTKIRESGQFVVLDRRFVEAALRDTRMRPDDLFAPGNMRTFTAVLERESQPFDYLLFASITSGTTKSNQDYQRDYMLTLSLVNIASGESDKESAELRKGYNKSVWAKIKNFGA